MPVGRVVLFAAAMTAGAASAQEVGNSLYVSQTGDANQLFIDQSAASGSSVGTEGAPAAQIGDGNRLTIADEGVGNRLPLLVQNNALGGGAPNIADITLGAASSEAEVSLTQSPLNANGAIFAGGNIAALNLSQGAAASIEQLGSGNNASLTVNGVGARGAVIQAGNNNVGVLTVGGNGASVTLNQSGNGLNSANVPQGANFTNGSTPGITVFSNGAAVSITQSN